jgi:hexokinase
MLRHNFFDSLVASASRRAAVLGAVMMATVLTNVGEQWACDRMSGVVALDGHFIRRLPTPGTSPRLPPAH